MIVFLFMACLIRLGYRSTEPQTMLLRGQRESVNLFRVALTSNGPSMPDLTISEVEASTGGHRPTKPDFIQARIALVLIISLQIFLKREVQVGAGVMSNWLLPIVELLLLGTLSSLTTIRLRRLRSGKDALEVYLERHGGAPRVFAVALIGLITATNVASLFKLIYALLHANKSSGLALLNDAANLWVTNVVCFALWYWELDRGGPGRRGLPGERRPDFLFANMASPQFCKQNWRPGFLDYLFLAFTNASAFSPTDALPLTRGAKVVMMVQASVSLLTIAIVAARAVNILS